MRQGVAIAIALLHRPKLVIADEPTTALYVSVRAEILTEMRELVREFGTALIWISHDLATVSTIAQRVAVRRHGTKLLRRVTQILPAPPIQAVNNVSFTLRRGGDAWFARAIGRWGIYLGAYGFRHLRPDRRQRSARRPARDQWSRLQECNAGADELSRSFRLA